MAMLLAQGHFSVYVAPMRMMSLGLVSVALACGGFVIAATRLSPDGMGYRALTCLPLTLLGRWSYGIYVIHPAVVQLVKSAIYSPVRNGLLGGSPLLSQIVYWLITLTASAAIAGLSFRLFESRFLALKRFFPMSDRKRESLEGVVRSVG